MVGGGGGATATHYHQVYLDDNHDIDSSNIANHQASTDRSDSVVATAIEDENYGGFSNFGHSTPIHRLSTATSIPKGRIQWRPWPLRPWYFVLLLMLHIISIITIQLINTFCMPSGCHIFGARSTTNVSVLDRVIYQALPPSFAVVFGIMWVFVSHDVFRLEPYFQMSKIGGVSAEDSILMQYTHLLPHGVLWRAIKRKHWVILLTATISAFISLGASPVLSGLFDNKMVQSSRNIAGKSLRLEKTHWNMTVPPGFRDVFYDNLKFNGSLPTFTTREYALHPIAVAPGSLPDVKSAGSNEVLVADTLLYESALDCAPAKLEFTKTHLNNGTRSNETNWWAYQSRWIFHVNLTSQEGIKASAILCYTEQSYLGWYDPAARRMRARDPLNPEKCDFDFTLRPGTIFNQGGSMGSFIGFGDVLRPTSGPGKVNDGEPGWIWSLWLGQYDMRNARQNTSDVFDPSKVGHAGTFCRPSYTKQKVRASFTRDGDVIKAERIGKKEPFNEVALSFEAELKDWYRMVYEGRRAGTLEFSGRSTTQLPVDRQFGNAEPGSHLVDMATMANSMYHCFIPNTTDPDYLEFLASWTLSVCASISRNSMFAYSTLLANLPADSNRFLEFDYTNNIFNKAFKMIFAFGMSLKMEELTQKPPPGLAPGARGVTVIRESSFRGFRPNKIWSKLGMGILAVVMVQVAILGWVVWRRDLALEGEPNTLSEALHLLASSTTLRKKFSGAEYSSRRELRDGLQKEVGYLRFKAVLKPGVGTVIEVVNIAQYEGLASIKELGLPQPHIEDLQTGGQKRIFLDNLQWQLRKRYNILLILAVAGMGVCLAVAYTYLNKLDGLPTFGNSTSSINYKVVYTYLPFVLSNTLAPLISSLARMHCMTAPYLLLKQARHSRFHASRSPTYLGLDFDALPPQLQFFRALKFRQFAIAGLSLAFLLSNVLSITMTSLFSPFSREILEPAPILNTGLPSLDVPNMISGTVSALLLRNLTGSTFASTWTTSQYYVLPFKPADLKPGVLTYTGETMGLGSSVLCSRLFVELVRNPWPLPGSNIVVSSQGTGGFTTVDANNRNYLIQLNLPTPYTVQPYAAWINYTNPVTGIMTEPTFNSDSQSHLAIAWAEWPGNPTPGIPPPIAPPSNVTKPENYNLARYFKNEWDSYGLRCSGTPKAARLRATIDVATSRVLNSTVLYEYSTQENIDIFRKVFYLFRTPDNRAPLATLWHSSLSWGIFPRCATSSLRTCAANYVMSKMEPNLSRKLVNETFIPDIKLAPKVMEDMLQRMAVLALRVNSFYNATNLNNTSSPPKPAPGGTNKTSSINPRNWGISWKRQVGKRQNPEIDYQNSKLRNSLNAAEPPEWIPSPISGEILYTIEKVGLSKPMLFISICILGIILWVLVYRLWVRQTMLGHLPTSLAETWAVLYATDAVAGVPGGEVNRTEVSVDPQGKKTSDGIKRRRKMFKGTYAYGEFYKRQGSTYNSTPAASDTGRGEHHFGVYCREFEEQGDGWKEVGGGGRNYGTGSMGATTWTGSGTAYDPGTFVNNQGGMGTMGYGQGYGYNYNLPQQQSPPPMKSPHGQPGSYFTPHHQAYTQEPESYYFSQSWGTSNTGNTPILPSGTGSVGTSTVGWTPTSPTQPSRGFTGQSDYVVSPLQSMDDYGRGGAAGSAGGGGQMAGWVPTGGVARFSAGRGQRYEPLGQSPGGGGGA